VRDDRRVQVRRQRRDDLKRRRPAAQDGLDARRDELGGPGRDARLLRTATALIAMLAPSKKRARRPRA